MAMPASLAFLKRKAVLPFVIIGVSVLIMILITSGGPREKPKAKSEKLPGIEYLVAKPGPVSIPVFTRGLVNPTAQVQLVAEVNGAVIEVSPNFVNGGFFKKGDVLLRIDPSYTEMEVAKAAAMFADANLKYAQIKAQVKSQGDITIDGIQRSTALSQGVPQRQAAEAALTAAETSLRLARNQLRKTTITAPFSGRILKTTVNINQAVAQGTPLAQIYGTSQVEIRLPISAEQMELVDIPGLFQNEQINEINLPLVLFEDSTGKYHWQGQVVRSEGVIDPTSRLIYIVAQVNAPYMRDPKQPDRPPLTAGAFVEAMVQGRNHKGIVVVPRDAVHNRDQVWVLDDENRITFRKVEILYRGQKANYISWGLQAGDRVVTTPLDIVVENMPVNAVKEVAPPAPEMLGDGFIPESDMPKLPVEETTDTGNASSPMNSGNNASKTPDTPAAGVKTPNPVKARPTLPAALRDPSPETRENVQKAVRSVRDLFKSEGLDDSPILSPASPSTAPATGNNGATKP